MSNIIPMIFTVPNTNYTGGRNVWVGWFLAGNKNNCQNSSVQFENSYINLICRSFLTKSIFRSEYYGNKTYSETVLVQVQL